MEKVPRRELIRGGLAMLCALPVMGTARAGQCVQESSEPLRESLNYQDPGPDPQQHCRDCGFFDAANATQQGCGHCMIMTGPVAASAWCESWSTGE